MALSCYGFVSTPLLLLLEKPLFALLPHHSHFRPLVPPPGQLI